MWWKEISLAEVLRMATSLQPTARMGFCWNFVFIISNIELVNDEYNRCGPVIGNEVGIFIHFLQFNNSLGLLREVTPCKQQALLHVSRGIFKTYAAVWDIHYPIAMCCEKACKCCRCDIPYSIMPYTQRFGRPNPLLLSERTPIRSHSKRITAAPGAKD